MPITFGPETPSLALAVAPTTATLRIVLPEDLKQASGGASDYLLQIDGIKGESTKATSTRPIKDYALITDFNVGTF